MDRGPLELLAQVETAPALLFAARRLLGALQVWLQARHCGILALELCWQMDARRDTATGGSLVVRTAMPTLDMVHLQRLLAENLARITLPAPVLTLRLRSIETAALSGASASLLPDEQTDGAARRPPAGMHAGVDACGGRGVRHPVGSR